jgi:glycosyltransferase involved in cell wall biosynthesis
VGGDGLRKPSHLKGASCSFRLDRFRQRPASLRRDKAQARRLMYIAEIPPFTFSAPWEKSFDERMDMLLRGSPRAAYFYEVPDTSTFRYRAYNVWQSLAAEANGGPSASWFHNGDFDRIERVLDRCDVLVLCRVHYSDRINRIVSWARARRCRVLFDVDDLVFDVRCAHTLMDTLEVELNDAAWQFWFGDISRIGVTMSLCDGVVVTNPYLAARAEAFLGKPAHIIPNFLNREQMELCDRIWRAKDQSNWARDSRIHLGYFSGTPSHNRDFALIAGPLARLMDEDERLNLRIVGYLDGVGPELQRHCTRIETAPLQDFLNLQRQIGKVEINLVPLQDNIFTNCKSELKWFEAAAVGAVTVAAPTYSYRHAIEHGTNGWLAPAYAWEDVLREVIRGGEGCWRPVAARARTDAEERFGWRNQSAAIRSALFDW